MNKKEIIKHVTLAYLTTQSYDPKSYHPTYTMMKFTYNTLTHQFDQYKIYDEELEHMIEFNTNYDISKDKFVVNYEALYRDIVTLLKVKGYED